MSWDKKDAQHQQTMRQPAPGDNVGPLPTVGAPTEQMLPTFAQAMGWGEPLEEDDAPQRLTMDQQREFADIGWLTDRQWDQWSRFCRRGVESL